PRAGAGTPRPRRLGRSRRARLAERRPGRYDPTRDSRFALTSLITSATSPSTALNTTRGLTGERDSSPSTDAIASSAKDRDMLVTPLPSTMTTSLAAIAPASASRQEAPADRPYRSVPQSPSETTLATEPPFPVFTT